MGFLMVTVILLAPVAAPVEVSLQVTTEISNATHVVMNSANMAMEDSITV